MELSSSQLLLQLQKGHQFGKSEIKYLLGLSAPSQIKLLFKTAQKVRVEHFGDRIFFYGFLYFSTYCRNSCRFCQYRQSNKLLSRYRKSEEEILEAAMELADAGVHLIDLTMGEDPDFYSSKKFGFQRMTSLIKKVAQAAKLPVMISPGSIPDGTLLDLARADIDWFACYQETHNQKLFTNLRPGQDFEERIAKKHTAKKNGLLIEEGILTGVGETLDDLADSIIWMRDNHIDQARVMTFIPQAGTPMAEIESPGDLQELITIAVMRLILPDLLIPASLDVDGLDGLKARLSAGANVVTSIVPPKKGLAGVANHSLDIEDSKRTLEHVLPVLKECSLQAATQEEYQTWVQNRKNNWMELQKQLRVVC